jgi:hypothetical protein
MDSTERPVADGWAEPDELIAYPITKRPRTQLVPASRTRPWIPATSGGSATWCMPLMLANGAGWEVLTPVGVTAEWDGGADQAALHIQLDGGPTATDMLATSDFGSGILSFRVPYLFRTAPGFDLLVRGPANRPRPGAYAYEGLVETDWAVTPFTMNWQLLQPGVPVRWEAGDAVAMLVPQRRGDLPALRPRVRPLSSAPETGALVFEAADQRRRLRMDNAMAEMANLGRRGRHELERLYYRGRYPDGRRAPAHRAAVQLRDFATEEAGAAGC